MAWPDTVFFVFIRETPCFLLLVPSYRMRHARDRKLYVIVQILWFLSLEELAGFISGPREVCAPKNAVVLRTPYICCHINPRRMEAVTKVCPPAGSMCPQVLIPRPTANYLFGFTGRRRGRACSCGNKMRGASVRLQSKTLKQGDDDFFFRGLRAPFSHLTRLRTDTRCMSLIHKVPA